MNYEDENWIKVYTRDTAGWLALEWQARGLMLEIARKLPKHTGELSLGRRGLEALGALIRAPWAEIEPYVHMLLEEGCLEYDQDRQLIRDPQHVDRQRAVSSGARRTEAWRDRKRTGGSDAPPPAPPAPPSSAPMKPRPPASRVAAPVPSSVTPRDVVTSHGDAVTSHGDAARLEEEKEKKEENRVDPPRGGSPARAPEGYGGKREIPEDEPLTDRRRGRVAARAEPKGMTLDAELEWSKFVTTSRANGKWVADVDAAWESWLIDAVKYAERDRRREREWREKPRGVGMGARGPVPDTPPAPYHAAARPRRAEPRMAPQEAGEAAGGLLQALGAPALFAPPKATGTAD